MALFIELTKDIDTRLWINFDLVNSIEERRIGSKGETKGAVIYSYQGPDQGFLVEYVNETPNDIIRKMWSRWTYHNK